MKAKRAASPSAKPLRGKKTWRQKLEDAKDLPKVVTLQGDSVQKFGGRTLAIPAPLEVDALMRKVRSGELTTIDSIRAAVARRHKSDAGCPITSGIFAWMAAHAADEAAAASKPDITPYWRTLKAKGELNPKYPGGIPVTSARLQAEGHAIIQRGKRFFVKDYDKFLARL